MNAPTRADEPVLLQRDCAARAVPSGQATQLAAGTIAYLTQALGGSFTVFVQGRLYRIDGFDADALGREPPPPLSLPADAAEADVEALAWTQLHACYDPEIPVDIVELGLVYALDVTPCGDGRRIAVRMTVTAPGCGMGEVIAGDVRERLARIPSVREVEVRVVFDPPWDRSRMSEAARLATGLF